MLKILLQLQASTFAFELPHSTVYIRLSLTSVRIRPSLTAIVAQKGHFRAAAHMPYGFQRQRAGTSGSAHALRFPAAKSGIARS